jgi:adenylate kinase family enzyme
MSKRIIRVVRRKSPVIDRGPKCPTTQKVVVLRRVRDGESYVHKEEIPVSIGIPEYFAELRELELARQREAEQFAHKIIIFLIGGPGSGKSTNSKRISETMEIGHLSVEDLLKAEASSAPEVANEQMPQETTISVIKQELIRQDKPLYLIDGFPRKVEHAVTFEETVCKAVCIVWLDVPEEVLLERLLEGNKEAGQQEDDPEMIKLKIKGIHEGEEAVFALFEETGRAVKIDGNQELDLVFEDIEKVVRRVINHEPLFPVVVEEEEQVEQPSE